MPPLAIGMAAGSAVAGIAGSAISANASKSAASQQAAAANNASALQQQEFQTSQANLAPYYSAGANSLGNETAMFGASNSPNPLTTNTWEASDPLVQQLSGQVAPSIVNAIQSGGQTGALPGGFTYQKGANGTFQLFNPTGQPVGSFGNNVSAANQIASALSVAYDNINYAGSAPHQQTTTALGLNDNQYGIPALGNTDFLNSMGVSNVNQLAFNPQGGSNFYQAMGVKGPQDLAFNPTQATLDNLPGYQFEMQQGEQATQNSAAAKGLGVSGAAMKAAAGYAQGLASTDLQNYYNQYEGNLTNQANIWSQNYNNQLSGWNTNLNTLSNTFANNLMNKFNINQTAVQNAYNRMNGISALGENAAATSGNQAVQTGANAGNSMIQAGNANASGTIGSANALSSGINSVASAPMNALGYAMMANQAANTGLMGYGNNGGYSSGMGNAMNSGNPLGNVYG